MLGSSSTITIVWSASFTYSSRYELQASSSFCWRSVILDWRSVTRSMRLVSRSTALVLPCLLGGRLGLAEEPEAVGREGQVIGLQLLDLRHVGADERAPRPVSAGWLLSWAEAQTGGADQGGGAEADAGQDDRLRSHGWRCPFHQGPVVPMASSSGPGVREV